MRRNQVTFSPVKDVETFTVSSADEDDRAKHIPSHQNLFDNSGDHKAISAEGSSRRLSWFSASTGDIFEPLSAIVNIDSHTVEKFKVLLKPPEFDNDDVLCAVHSFMKGLADYIPSIRHDKSFQTIKATRKLLREPDCVRLYGLLVHFCYWNIIHPVVKKVIHDLRSSKPQFHLFEGIAVTIDAADRTKLPKALLDLVAVQKRMKMGKTFSEIDSMFRLSAKQTAGEQNELDEHVAEFLNTNYGPHYDIPDLLSDAGMSMEGHSVDSLSSAVSLSLQEKENLYVQLETCLTTIYKKVSSDSFDPMHGRPDIFTFLKRWAEASMQWLLVDRHSFPVVISCLMKS